MAGLMSALGSSAVGPAAKVLFAFPLVYHYGSSVRHFVSGIGVSVGWAGRLRLHAFGLHDGINLATP